MLIYLIIILKILYYNCKYNKYNNMFNKYILI